MRVIATAEVQYTCYLSEEDTEKVIKKAKELAKQRDGFYEDYICETLLHLHYRGVIDLYKKSVESDFQTMHIEEFDIGDEEE